MAGKCLVIAAGLALAILGGARAQTLSICIDDRVGLDRWTLKAFDKELSNIADDLWLVPCAKGRQGAVVTIHAEAPQRYAMALGLAWRRSGQILPNLEIYVNPIVRLLGNTRAPSVVGRALARVTAHELQHLLTQRSDHDDRGLFAESFRPADLGAEYPAPFNIPD